VPAYRLPPLEDRDEHLELGGDAAERLGGAGADLGLPGEIEHQVEDLVWRGRAGELLELHAGGADRGVERGGVCHQAARRHVVAERGELRRQILQFVAQDDTRLSRPSPLGSLDVQRRSV
jgi:hypothetical protein